MPFNKRHHTLKNDKRSPRYLIGQIAGQMIKKIGTCILLWYSNISNNLLLSPVLLLFPLFLIICNDQYLFNIYDFLNITDELIKK